MDQELIAYLDRRFGDLDKSLDRRFGEVGSRLDEVDRRFDEADDRFGGLGEQIEALREHVDTQNRHTHVVVEDLRSKVETLAASVAEMNARHDRSKAESETERQKDLAFSTTLFSDVKGRVDDHEVRLSDCEARVRRLESAGG